MKKGLFLNGIYVPRNGIAVDEAVVFAIPILPYLTVSPLSFRNDTFSWTEFTLNPFAFKR